MNAFSWCRLVLCAAWLTAWLATSFAHAQRVRFASRDNSAAASESTSTEDGWVSAASRYVSTSPTPPSSSTAKDSSGSTTKTPAYSTVDTPVYMDTPVYVASAETKTSVPAPPPSYDATANYRTATPAATTSLTSPAAAYGASFSQPVLVAGAWDPYQVASRHAAFAGTVVSNPGMPGQFTLPQPMPRVPYYTQQPVVGAPQPYVVIPEAGCAAPFPTQVMPLSAPGAVPTTAPAYVPPMIPAMSVPPTVPTLAPALAAPLGTSRNCYAQVDAIFFTRDARIGNTPLVLLDMNGATQSNVLSSTADLDFEFEPGPRVLLGTEFDGFRAIEASYFGIYTWDDKVTIDGDNNLNLPGDLGLAGALDFFNADQMVVTYNTDVHNGELNYLQHYGNVAWLVGFRYFNLSEKFSINSTDNQTGSSFYDISTYNNLFGGQLGGRIKQACGNWSYDLTGKAGVYGNVIRSSQRVGDFDGFVLRDTHGSGGQVSFLGELGLSGYYKFSECLSLRGGYQVYWIEGLALAPRQLDFTDTPTSGGTLDKTGGMFMHGAHAGLMAQW